MQKDNNLLYIALGAVAIAAYIISRNKSLREEGAKPKATVACQSLNTNDDIIARADDIRNIIVNEWYKSDSDWDRIVNICRGIQDECGARKLFQYAGTINTYLYGSGDLSYWFSTAPSDHQLKLKAALYGVQ